MEKGLIKITGFFTQVWRNGSPTTETKVKEVYINPSFIISVEDTVMEAKVNSFVSIAEQRGCLITVAKGLTTETYQHNKSAEHFYQAIRTLYRMAL